MKMTFRCVFLMSLIGCLAVFSITETRSDEQKAATGKTSRVKVRDITLQIPDSWKQQEPSNRLRLAQFQISPAQGDASETELVIYSFAGGGGGVDANIRRWIGQFQAEDREVQVHSGTCPQGKYVIIDLAGTYNKPVGPPVLRKTEPTPNSRMLGAILTTEKDANYFLKMTGPEKTVAATAKAFRQSFGADPAKEKQYEVDGQ